MLSDKLLEAASDGWSGNATAIGIDDMQRIVKEHEEKLKEVYEAVREAQWLRDHIMGKKKRINWGDTFDIDFGRMNEAFIKFDRAAGIMEKE